MKNFKESEISQKVTDNSGSIEMANITGDGNQVGDRHYHYHKSSKEKSEKISIIQSLIGKTKNFVGRQHFIDKISELVDKSSQPISIIGEAGLGKSQLAYEVISRFDGRFDKVILFDFTKFRSYEKFLADFALYLGLQTEEFERIKLENKPHAILNELGRLGHVLIYADNFETLSGVIQSAQSNQNKNDVRHIIRLLESLQTNTLILLTSRIRKNIDSERTINLEGLSNEEGTKLFLKYAPKYNQKEPSNNTITILERLSEKTGGHPLSIELLARSYKGNGIPELEEMFEHLGVGLENSRELNEKLRSLDTCFGISIDALDGDHAGQLPELSVFSSYFTPQGANEILGIGNEALQEFYDHGLLRRIDFDEDNPLEFRLYGFHLATKNYLQKQIDMESLEQKVKESFTEYYVDLAFFTYNALSSDNRVPAVNRFRIMMNGENDFEKATALSGMGVASIYGNIGAILKDQGDLKGALEYAKKALEIDERNGDNENMITNYNNIGQILQAQGDLKGALEYAKKALEIDEKRKDEVKMAIRYSNIGYILQDMGEENKAQEFFKKAAKMQK